MTKKKTEKKGGLRRKAVKRSPLKRMLITRKRPISQLKKQQKKKLSLRNLLKNVPRRRRLGKRNCKETVSKKAKGDNSSQQAREGDESLQKKCCERDGRRLFARECSREEGGQEVECY